jgi:hypothetical protein
LGGLPLYVGGWIQLAVAGTLVAVAAALVALVIWRWPTVGSPEPRFLIALAAAAPAAGLILLGVCFSNTPIELRYLAFSMPFVGPLLAGAVSSLPRRSGMICGTALISLQALALAGMLTRAETMQPDRATAAAAAALAGPEGVVLLPWGNDGVGVPGPFLADAPDWLRVMLVNTRQSAAAISAALTGVPRVVLALLEPDADSRLIDRTMRVAVAGQCWRRSGTGFMVMVFDRVCDGD